MDEFEAARVDDADPDIRDMEYRLNDAADAAAAARRDAAMLDTEVEHLRQRVSALEAALMNAGITIPPTRAELAAMAAADVARLRSDPWQDS